MHGGRLHCYRIARARLRGHLADSDVDVLIDIAPGRRFSLVDLVSVKDFLEDRLGRKVDVVTREGLDPARVRQLVERNLDHLGGESTSCT